MRIFVFQIAVVALALLSFEIKSGVKSCVTCTDIDSIPKSKKEAMINIVDSKLDSLKKDKLEELSRLKEEQGQLLRKIYTLKNNVYVFTDNASTNKIELWY